MKRKNQFPNFIGGAPPICDVSHVFPNVANPGKWLKTHLLPLQERFTELVKSKAFDDGAMPFLFPNCPGKLEPTMSYDIGDKPVWFIGDIHGDFLAFLLLTQFAGEYDAKLAASASPAQNERTNLFFLGDFIDDGTHAPEIMAWLLATAAGMPLGGAHNFNIHAILGNHDEGLAFDEQSGGFYADVTPSNFFSHLNATPNPATDAFGKAVIAFFKKIPRLVFLNKNILAVHGGLPTKPVLRSIATIHDLQSPSILLHYIWARLLPDEPRSPDDSGFYGPTLGYEDFDDAIELISKLYGATPKWLVRGHDHVPDNYKFYTHYTKCKVLTTNTFMVNSRGGQRYRPATIIRANRPASDPMDVTVFQFTLPEPFIEEYRSLPSFIPRS